MNDHPPPPRPPPYSVTDVPPPRPARTLYFAYGTDMQIAHMARTCPNSRYIGRAVLTDYKWHINGLGFANLTKIKTAHAPGLVFEVDDTDKANLEANRFPLYKSVTIDAELYPAPFCLYRRQATWITKHGGPEAVLEEAYATGRGNDRRASYTERGILVFMSLDVTVDGRPDARYAEAINAAAADAMALGIEPLFFEKIVQQFMPGRMLPYLRVVRRGRTTTSAGAGAGAGSGGAGGSSPDLSAKLTAAVAAAALRAVPPPSVVVQPASDDGKPARTSTDSLRPERTTTAKAEREKEKETSKPPASSGFGETIRTMFQRQRHSRRKESAESGEGSSAAVREAREAAGGRHSPLLTGSESGGNASGSDEGNNSGGSGSYYKLKKKASTSPSPSPSPRPSSRPNTTATSQGSAAWAPRIVSASSSATAIAHGSGAGNTNRHSKSQSESSLVDARPPAPTITISRPSRNNTIERGVRTRFAVDADKDEDEDENDDEDDESSTDSEIESDKETTSSRTATSTTAQRARPPVIAPPPPPLPTRPPPERANAILSGYVRVYGVTQKKTASDSVRQVDPALIERAQSAVPTVGAIRRDTSGWETQAAIGGSSSSSSSSSSRSRLAVERKPVGKKRPSTDEVLRMRAAANLAITAEMVEEAEEAEEADEAKEAAETEKAGPVGPPSAPVREAPREPPVPPPTPAPSKAPPPVPTKKAPEVPVKTPTETPTETVKETFQLTRQPSPLPPPTRVPTTPAPRPTPAPTPTPTLTPTPTPAPVRKPVVPRRPMRQPRGAQNAAAAAAEKEQLLRRPKSFCGSARPLSRFDRFLLQAAEHPHFAAKPWLPAFQRRTPRQLQHSHFQSHFHGQMHGQVHGHFYAQHTQMYIHTPRHRLMFSQTTVVAGTLHRERRMSF